MAAAASANVGQTLTRYQVLISCAIVALALALFMLRVSRNMPDFEVYWTGAGHAARAEPLYRDRGEDQHYQFKPGFPISL